MSPIRSITCLIVGFALAAILCSGLDLAHSKDEETPRAEASQQAHLELVNRVRRALSPATADTHFQLVVVATGDGIYTECFGALEPEEAAILAHKLHALADLAGAEAEVLCEDEEDEPDEEEQDDDDFDDSEDDDSENDDEPRR